MGSGVVLTERIESKVRKITAHSLPPTGKISLKSHRFEKIPQEEKVRKSNQLIENLHAIFLTTINHTNHVLIFSWSLTPQS